MVPIYDSDNLQLGPCTIYIGGNSVGIIGDVTVGMGTGAAPLTGAHMGDVPLDKVITGGHFTFTIQFKEMTLQNFALAFPNCVLSPGKTHVDFMPRIGLSLRSIAEPITLKQIVGGVETTDPSRIIVAPLASPVEGDIDVGYTPTTQRILTAKFETWPDDISGRWGYMGDELGS